MKSTNINYLSLFSSEVARKNMDAKNGSSKVIKILRGTRW
jgi:hypothetical protein